MHHHSDCWWRWWVRTSNYMDIILHYSIVMEYISRYWPTTWLCFLACYPLSPSFRHPSIHLSVSSSSPDLNSFSIRFLWNTMSKILLKSRWMICLFPCQSFHHRRLAKLVKTDNPLMEPWWLLLMIFLSFMCQDQLFHRFPGVSKSGWVLYSFWDCSSCSFWRWESHLISSSHWVLHSITVILEILLRIGASYKTHGPWSSLVSSTPFKSSRDSLRWKCRCFAMWKNYLIL